MNPKKAATLLIIISLIAAAAIMFSSCFLDGRDTSQTVMFLIIAVWFVPFTWLSARAAGKKSGDNSE